MQKLGTHLLDEVSKLAMSKTFRCEPVNDPEGVAEFIIKTRSNDADGKRCAHVADAFPDMVPDVRDFLRGSVALQIDKDCRNAGAREAAQEIETRRFLKRTLKALGYLLERFVHRSAGPGGLNHHRLDDERGILAAAEPEVRHYAGAHRNDHEEDRERTMCERPFRKVQSGHDDGDPSKRTFWPGCNACTPAVTTISPVSSPSETATVAGS